MAKNSRTTIAEGFTLVELLVVIMIVAVITVSVIGFLNPFEQFTKANDTQREHDLNQIRVAVDTYYNDTGCYPSSVPFGAAFVSPKDSKVIYMKAVPQDPKCASNAAQCYQYITDPYASCPQWNVLLGSLRAASSTTQGKTLCSLESLDASTTGGCLPTYYKTNKYNFCLTSGQLDCTAVSSAGYTTPAPGGSVPTSTPTSYSISPTPTPIPGCTAIYACTNQSVSYPNGICNNVGTVGGVYCGTPGCFGNACCSNSCSQ